MYLGRRPDKTSFVYISVRAVKNKTRIDYALSNRECVINDFFK